jgi:lincosamide nucleotidyltransferase A/C/D/E
VREQQVTELVRGLLWRGFRIWIAGGWAVDAVVGRVTRPHGDLDIAADADQLEDLLGELARQGFAVTVDWLPARVEVAAPDGRRVDIHPVVFASDGSGVQSGRDGAPFTYAADGFTEGRIGGVPVPCLSVEQQLRFREGYELRDVDRHDIPLLLAVRKAGNGALGSSSAP